MTRPVMPLTTWEEASANNPNLTRERWEKGEEIKRSAMLDLPDEEVAPVPELLGAGG